MSFAPLGMIEQNAWLTAVQFTLLSIFYFKLIVRRSSSTSSFQIIVTSLYITSIALELRLLVNSPLLFITVSTIAGTVISGVIYYFCLKQEMVKTTKSPKDNYTAGPVIERKLPCGHLPGECVQAGLIRMPDMLMAGLRLEKPVQKIPFLVTPNVASFKKMEIVRRFTDGIEAPSDLQELSIPSGDSFYLKAHLKDFPLPIIIQLGIEDNNWELIKKKLETFVDIVEMSFTGCKVIPPA